MERVEVKKRVRDESEIVSPEVKRLREDLLDVLDDDPELCTFTQDLDSFMKSFQDEISASPSGTADGCVDLESESGESRPELGYLLEASDDELGIPPPTASLNELVTEFGDQFWEAPGSETLGLGLGEAETYNGDYVALNGLFDYSDMGFGSGDVSWIPETMPAL